MLDSKGTTFMPLKWKTEITSLILQTVHARHPTLSPSSHSYAITTPPYSCQPRSNMATSLRQMVWCSFIVCVLRICLSSASFVRLLYKINSLLLLGGKGNQFLKTTTISIEGFATRGLGRGFPLFSSFSAQDQLFPTGVVPPPSKQSTSRGVAVSTYKRLCHCQSHWQDGHREQKRWRVRRR